MRVTSKLSVVAAAAVVAAACAACTTQGSAPVKLSPVASVPKPALPAWISSISPTGSAQSLAQIRVIFKKPITKVESLSGNGPSDVLSHVSIDPDLKGHFTVLTPRMIGFVGDQAIPTGTRIRITLSAGLRDLDGDSLDKDLAWTFETDPIAFTDLPQLKPDDDDQTPPPSSTDPTIKVTANAGIDVASLASHATLNGAGDEVPLAATLEAQPTPYPGGGATELYDPSVKTWIYDLKPQRSLKTATTYELRLAPGIDPAYGNIATSKSFIGQIKTYDVLSIVPTPTPSPGSGGDITRFAGGDPVIAFSNPLDAKTVANAVTVSPAPGNVKTLVTVPDDANNTITINPYALDPNATYTVTLAPTLGDVFGQTLGSAQTVTVKTGNFAAGAWAPSGTSVIPASLDVALNFYATNLPGNSYSSATARLDPLAMLGGSDAITALPEWEGWPSSPLAGAKPNVQSVVRVPLRAKLGGPFGTLAYGFRTALDAKDSSPGLVGIAQLTNLGVFAQWFPAHGVVLVQHLSDGAPVSGATVTVYRNVTSSTATPAQCAQGKTNADGSFNVQGVDIERCYAGSPTDEAPAMGVTVTEGGDVATLTTSPYAGVYRFNSVNGGWSAGAPLSRGTIFSDRDLYQPGERAQFTGIAYYVSGDKVVADRNASYDVTLSDPDNNKTSLGKVNTDAYGVFTMPINFSKTQALGYYSLSAKGSNGNTVDGSFRVAEFKPPNFKMDVTLSATTAQVGSSVTANAAASYLFGAPLQGGTAHAYVTRQTATLAPKGWDEFSFGPQWFWPEETPSFDSDVVQKDLPLDADGKASLDVAVPADLPFPMTYRVDMQATDVSNLSVTGSQSFLALPSDAMIGLASNVVGSAGTAMPIRVIVTDPDGKPVSGRSVHLELDKMTYASATQSVGGGEDAQQTVKYDQVATADTTSSDSAVTVNLTPTDTGPYRVRANFGGASSAASASDIQVFAFGPGEADWGQSDPNNVEIKLDKKTYAPGDTATALIASPFEKSDVYVSVVRGDTMYRTIVRGASGAVKVPFKITPDMLPNAAIEAVVVRRGAPIASVKPGSLDTLARTGMTGFDVDVSDRYLKLGIVPGAATVHPGGNQSVTFNLATKAGAHAQGEIVAMVVNDAILQLSGYRLPDLVTTVFADQPISTTFSDNREGMVLKTQTPPNEKGYGYGGGYAPAAAGTRVRANFLPTAYYGAVKTDASGNATIRFSMPDDLTTWRVMAVAIGNDDSHFATSDTTFISNQPLMSNPLLPQFARPGDTFQPGVSISNQTGTTGALDLVLQLTGALAFSSGDPHSQTASEQTAAGMQAFRFPVSVGTPAPTTFQVTSKLGTFSDAFRVPFTVSETSGSESVIESSATAANGTSNVPIGLDKGGFVKLTLANSIVPQFAVPSNRWMNEDALPLADFAASRLIIASALQGLKAPYKLDLTFDPGAAVASNFILLKKMQRDDGGFGEWVGAKKSNPWVSPYVLTALVFARDHGVAVDGQTIDDAKSYLASVLSNPDSCVNDQQCKRVVRFAALWALAQAGDRRTDFLSDIVAHANDDLSSAGQIELARYLLQTPGWQDQGAKLADRLQQAVYVTGRYSVYNVELPWDWWGSAVTGQAQMLQLLLQRHAPVEQLDGAVRELVAQQCKCGWPTLNDTAQAMIALSAYAATEKLAPSSATVTVGGATVASASFGSTASSQTFTLPASSLHGDAVSIASKGGRVHYTLLYTYPVPDDAPGQLAAFRVIRTVSAPGPMASPIATMDIAPSTGVQVEAGQVFDVGVRVIVDHVVSRLVIEDPLPAGFEAVDTSFRTTLQAVVPQSDSWDIDSQTIYRDKVVAFAGQLGPGVYDVHYLVRSVTPGQFKWPGARAYLVDAPEEFGRSASSTLQVK